MRYFNKILVISLILINVSCIKNKPQTIKVGLLNGPTAVSFAQMMCADIEIDGRKLEFMIYDEPLHIQALMIQNKLDFAVLPTVMAANLYNKGITYQTVGISVWGSLYLVERVEEFSSLTPRLRSGTDSNHKLNDNLTHRNSDYESGFNYNLPTELHTSQPERSRRLYIFGQASTADVLFQKMLKEKKIEDVIIDYSYNSNMELANAMLQGKLQAAVISEPLASMLEHRDSTIKITQKIDFEDKNKTGKKYTFAQTSLVVNSRLSRDNIELVKAFTAFYKYSCDFCNQETLKTTKLLVKQGIYKDENLAIKSIPLCNIDFQYASDFREEIEDYLKIFYIFESKSVGGKLPDKNFILDINQSN